MLFGSCPLILEWVRQPLWEQVQEKYWPNKVISEPEIWMGFVGRNTLLHNFEEMAWWPEMPDLHWKKYDTSVKQIHLTVSTTLRKWKKRSWTLEPYFSELLDTWMKNCDSEVIFIYEGGLICLFLRDWSPRSDFIWPILFLHPLPEGLPHSSQYQMTRSK